MKKAKWKSFHQLPQEQEIRSRKKIISKVLIALHLLVILHINMQKAKSIALSLQNGRGGKKKNKEKKSRLFSSLSHDGLN